MSHLTREVLLSGGKDPPTERDLRVARTWQIWLMDADGGGQRALTTGDDPAWSPDSTRVLFPATYEPQHGEGSAPIDGTNPRTLFYVGYSGDPAGFSWRP
jgi:Tol biopolymer transport system component